MKNLFAITLILFIGLTACKKEAGPIPSNQTNPKLFPTNAKVMCLGDSRVEGGRPLYESYRYELCKNLKDKGRTFDFIGVQVDDTSYPTYNGESFDTDHFGFGGEKTKGLYKKARQGKIPNFTGIDSIYEKPTNPELEIDTSKVSLSKAVKKILNIIT